MPSIHRLGRGLQGYLIPFAPHAFVHERQVCSSILPSHLVFLPILTHFTTTPVIPYTSPNLESSRIPRGAEVELRHLTRDVPNRLRTLYAQLIRITLGVSVLPLLLAQS
jgi:hypothetical protein